MKQTVCELIERLQQFPKNMSVQLDIEGQLWNEMEIDATDGKLIIFSKGDPDF